ncbi:hypothetical protein C4561_01470 [candidate division WWE3 bacterium]|jgi:hypothetical protein|uniref:Uncharacterized protein n=1 Tax=candidate division WWE3 bacterium TaxID=2053526 RepID=A0A3A4ZFC4_UNCKA|nr:MAG: hypothetical protein C4561_01470 [candidate division WWE3 bacterium]
MLGLRNLMESALQDTSNDVKEAQKRVVDKFSEALDSGKISLANGVSLREAFDVLCNPKGDVDLGNSARVAEAMVGTAFPYFTEKVLVPIIRREYEWALNDILSLCTETTTNKQTVNVPGLGNFQGAEKVGSGQEYVHDQGEENMCTVKLHKYGHIIDITREAILNDEAGILESRAAGAGKYMGRLIHEIGVKKLTNVTTISLNGEGANTAFTYNETGYAHFSTDHSSIDGQTNSNVDTTAFSYAGITAVEKLLLLMKDDRGKRAPVMPKVLMVPVALRQTAMQLLGSERQYDNANNAVNVYKNAFVPFYSPFLDDNSSTLYYLGDPKTAFYLFWRMRPTTTVQSTGSDDAFKRDIVLAYKYASEFNFGLLDYRVVARGSS